MYTKKRIWFIGMFVLFLSIITSCASLSSEKKQISPLKELCEAEGKLFVYDPVTKQARCDAVAKDAGERCTKTTDCEGYCAGSPTSNSSGTCSEALQPSGCVLIVERGERFERCFT